MRFENECVRKFEEDTTERIEHFKVDMTREY